MQRLGFAGLLALASITAAAPAMATNLVTNGDFSAGDSGFTTDYLLSPPTAEGPGNYWVTTSPHAVCDCFATLGDHTTGTGNMLVLDGAANAGSRFWAQTIAVTANTDYDLSFWAANLNSTYYGGPQANISVRIGGVEVYHTGVLPYAAGMSPTAVGAWSGFSTLINSGSSTSLQLSFVDTANIHDYNDFAFDDVSLVARATGGAVPEPGVWALMIAGFGMVGASLRRRRRRAA
jgi:hypothetical protein